MLDSTSNSSCLDLIRPKTKAQNPNPARGVPTQFPELRSDFKFQSQAHFAKSQASSQWHLSHCLPPDALQEFRWQAADILAGTFKACRR